MKQKVFVNNLIIKCDTVYNKLNIENYCCTMEFKELDEFRDYDGA
jgi:hypothetical protein